MKSLEEYQKLNYKMEIEFIPEEECYFVIFPELPGCMADGKTPNEAVKEALKVKNKWLEIAIQSGWTVPEPAPKIETSGRLTVRLPKYLHKKVIEKAAQEGVSQNQLITTYIAEGLERSGIEDTIKQFGKKLDATITRLESTTATASLRGATGGAGVVYGAVQLEADFGYPTTEASGYFNLINSTVLTKPLSAKRQSNRGIEDQFTKNPDYNVAHNAA